MSEPMSAEGGGGPTPASPEGTGAPRPPAASDVRGAPTPPPTAVVRDDPVPPTGAEALARARDERTERYAGRRSVARTVVILLCAPLALLLRDLLGIVLGSFTPLGDDLGFTCAFAVVAMVAVGVAGGWGMFSIRGAAIAEAWRRCWWALVPTVLMTVITIVANVSQGVGVNPDWAVDILYVAVLCVFIGVSEEGFFRGFLFNGLLSSLGGTRAGTFVAAVVASALFGLAHIDWLSADFSNPVIVSQAVLKALQTALYSFPLCAVVARTRNLVGTATLHAVDDFLLYAVTMLFTPMDLSSVSYLDDGEDAGSYVVLYAVSCLMYLPLIPIGVREFWRAPVPYYGEFARGAAPVAPRAADPARPAPCATGERLDEGATGGEGVAEAPRKPSGEQDGRPVPPEGYRGAPSAGGDLAGTRAAVQASAGTGASDGAGEGDGR